MSIFNELLPKLREISNSYTKNINDQLTVAFESLEKFEEEYRNGRTRGRDKAQKDKVRATNLQSICEDDVEAQKETVTEPKGQTSKDSSSVTSSTESNGERASKKRSKNEVEDMLSPEVDKRQKRNASVKAQSNISKQVNVNLTAKLRRETSNEKVEKTSSQSSKGRRRKNDEKENSEPNIPIQIKEEKISLPPEPMDMDVLNIPVKQENPDEIAMPPPAVPIPKPRKAIVKEKSEDSSEEEPGKRRARTKKQTEAMPPPPVAATRSTRSSSRPQTTESEEPPIEGRPKRTRAKKKISVSVPLNNDVDSIQAAQDNSSAASSPAEKPRPKRTRRRKAAAKENPKSIEPILSPKEERISPPCSPILPKSKPKKGKSDLNSITIQSIVTVNSTVDNVLEETRVLSKDLDKTRVIAMDKPEKQEMDTTMVLTNGVYKHAQVTPTTINKNMNETVVIEKAGRGTIVLEKEPNVIMDATVVIEKGIKTSNLTEDNSLITDDESEQEVQTPPRKDIKQTQPSSAVKEKVQQFEEMASRVTRTKTRAMAKKEEQDTHTPPDKIAKPILSAETLHKMNSLIFNGKAPQVSSSASKPRSAAPAGKSLIPSSTSKLSSISKHKEAADELKTSRTNEEDARKKKEAMLEAKREQQRRKREDKMAAAAAARNNAEKERQAQLEAAAKERIEKQAHADKGKLERMKEAERKKLELARKVAETEERRKAEEAARMQRLAEEQRKALAQRRKQLEEQEAMKKEALAMSKEMEKRNKEYLEKQKMKSRNDDKMGTPLRTHGTPGAPAHPMEPVHMADGFQYLYSDEEAEPPPRPALQWCTSKARKQQLDIQSHIASVHIERLFSVRVHSPDLRGIFPNIERGHLKRTSSAVWRTPPSLLRTVLE